jgi:hypothetical protein
MNEFRIHLFGVTEKQAQRVLEERVLQCSCKSFDVAHAVFIRDTSKDDEATGTVGIVGIVACDAHANSVSKCVADLEAAQ